MSRVSELKAQILTEIKDFLDSRNIVSLESVDVDEGNSPIIIENWDDENQTYTLDRIVRYDEYNAVKVDASSSYNSGTYDLDNLDIEVLEGILDWLIDNVETIDEILNQEEEE